LLLEKNLKHLIIIQCFISTSFGRKWTVYVGLVIQGAIALGVMFSPNYIVFTVLRFVLGAVTIGGLIAQFTLSEFSSLVTHYYFSY